MSWSLILGFRLGRVRIVWVDALRRLLDVSVSNMWMHDSRFIRLTMGTNRCDVSGCRMTRHDAVVMVGNIGRLTKQRGRFGQRVGWASNKCSRGGGRSRRGFLTLEW